MVPLNFQRIPAKFITSRIIALIRSQWYLMLTKSLSSLLSKIPGILSAPQEDALIRGIKLDSRQVTVGDVFVALPGSMVDGHRFIPEAIARGASAVFGSQPLAHLSVPYVRVAQPRLALAYLSAAFYDFPARQLTVIGITGTDGKTTTCNLIYQILRAAGIGAGMISTVNALIGDEVLDTGFHVTTPEAPEVQRYLFQMVQRGLTHVVLEATSHGLAQQRVAVCEFDVGVVTNITHEHLDFHGTYEAYRQAKGILFTSLKETFPKASHPPRAAVLNADDASFSYLSEISHVPQLTYGLHPSAQVHAHNLRPFIDGLDFDVTGKNLENRPFHIEIHSPLVGEFNLYNCLAALATTVGVLGVPVERAAEGVAAFSGVSGRMEKIDLGQPFVAMVDFAHTPNALRLALLSARRMTQGRLIAVFGSAGLRDRLKRRMMAEVSVQLADLTVLTAEDPRTEPLGAILDEMAQGARNAGALEGENFWRVPDRREAIRFALRQARPGDLVLLCGKGHEQSMCFGEVEYPWDDRIALRAALAELLGIAGPPMPFLPDVEG